jgi:hypothetical protein
LIYSLSHGPETVCKRHSYRRELGSLDASEKDEYTRAVTCLTATASIPEDTGDLYDNFSYVHFKNGEQHKSVARRSVGVSSLAIPSPLHVKFPAVTSILLPYLRSEIEDGMRL